jgi:hypothetical protein
MRALATRDDFEARYGAADATVEAWLADASTLIRAEVAGSEVDWVTDDESDVPDAVKVVCISVAYRAWSNPAALSRNQLGAAAVSYRDEAPDALYLTDHERSTVRGAARLTTFRSVTLVSPYSTESATSERDFL